ncbi:hypothetical protein HDU87_004201 [Geranomyces variabilis]|uniref:non-specific serine/threonine protein kinase n=1 Tax=Geranomyces variabilis TaxID=109894 RepID=A0AAD5TIZ6_9FUNG|nr:hypothetical protein HDU87_004201 [Geranomyces variabilis]
MIDPADPNCLLGTTVGDHLTLNRVLGMGSFAIVYEGASTRSKDSNETFAVKVLFKQNLTPELLAVQKREAQLMADLGEHANIVALLETYETDECFYLVMEIMETDLFDLIERSEVAFESIPAVFDAICAAVVFAHEKGVYHRDLKPENVLVSADLRAVKLTDFGLATTDRTSTEIGIGSVRYMDPQCFGEQQEYDCAKNDAWALGVILLNLLTGQNPWVEPSKLTDRYYADFAELGIESFRRRYGFSDELLAVLHKCFIDRVGVAELRALVAGVEFFYAPMSDNDNDEEREATTIAAAPAPVPTVRVAVPTTATTPTKTATPTTTTFSSWADDDGEMDYLDYAAYLTPTTAKVPAVPKLVCAVAPAPAASTAAPEVEPTLDAVQDQQQPQQQQDKQEDQQIQRQVSLAELPAPPPPTPAISRRNRNRRQAVAAATAPAGRSNDKNTSNNNTNINNINNNNAAQAATELVRNTIGRLQCFLAGVGENISTFDRGVVYVVGG